MLSWFRRLVSQPGAPALPPTTLPPSWASELQELLQRAVRAQSRMGVSMEDLQKKLEGGFEDLRSRVASLQPLPHDGAELRWDDLLDALDLLEQVTESPEVAAQAGLSQGLQHVRVRLERMLGQASLQRLSTRGVAPDGKAFRIVGTQYDPALPEGVVARVVRAAVRRGDRLLREGEVLTNRRPA